jgi:replicative DNA helicase
MDRQPWSEEAERALLCSMLIDNDATAKAIQAIESDMLFKMSHSRMFGAMRDLFREGQTIDAVTVSEVLKSRGELDSAGGYAFIGRLIDVVPNANNVDSYAKIVKDKYTMRRLLKAASAIESAVENNSELTTHDILDIAEKEIFSVTADVVKKDTRTAKDILWETFDSIEERIRHGGRVPGVPTGFWRLDNMTAGLKPGQLVVIAGRPAMGKTSLALNVALNAAVRHDIGVALFSLEMSEGELMERMLSSEGSIDSQKLRIGELNDDMHKRLAKAGGLIAEAPIFINDSAGMTPLEMKANLRRLMTNNNIGLVIVDYLQLMYSGGKSSNRTEEVGKISRDLKVMARDLEVPVIAVSQLNRGPENREDPRPMLSDLRESGSIEQDADVVMFVFREEVYTGPVNKKGENVAGKAELLISKQRNGPIGKLIMNFDGRFTRFEQADIATTRAISYDNEKEDDLDEILDGIGW